MKKDLSTKDETASSTEDKVFEFLELSQKILTLVNHENAILKSCGCLTLESYLEHRNSLLIDYELAATDLIENRLKETTHSTTKTLLATELSAVKAALSDNTFHLFKSLENKISTKSGESLWH